MRRLEIGLYYVITYDKGKDYENCYVCKVEGKADDGAYIIFCFSFSRGKSIKLITVSNVYMDSFSSVKDSIKLTTYGKAQKLSLKRLFSEEWDKVSIGNQ